MTEDGRIADVHYSPDGIPDGYRRYVKRGAPMPYVDLYRSRARAATAATDRNICVGTGNPTKILEATLRVLRKNPVRKQRASRSMKQAPSVPLLDDILVDTTVSTSATQDSGVYQPLFTPTHSDRSRGTGIAAGSARREYRSVTPGSSGRSSPQLLSPLRGVVSDCDSEDSQHPYKDIL